MKEYRIEEKEAGQTLLKFLQKYLPLAPSSFFYKMLRKKNIKYNNQKADGKEKLQAGDLIQFYLSDETLAGFQKNVNELTDIYEKAYRTLKGIQVIYENEHILLLNKPFHILTQKSAEQDLSLNEWMIGYLLAKGELSEKDLQLYRPSVCNRLDRNTCGIVLCSKTIRGGQFLSEWIRLRKIRKFYHLFVKGTGLQETTLKGYLTKDAATNRVTISNLSSEGDYIETRYLPLQEFSDRTLVEVELITGKTHQIRAHMASIGHPLLGDYKYGDAGFNNRYRQKYGINHQMLCSCRIQFPPCAEIFPDLSEKTISISDPDVFRQLSKPLQKG